MKKRLRKLHNKGHAALKHKQTLRAVKDLQKQWYLAPRMINSLQITSQRFKNCASKSSRITPCISLQVMLVACPLMVVSAYLCLEIILECLICAIF